MAEILIEACCASAEDALAAFAGGADRVELNSALFLGGLTPTVGAMRAIRQATHAPVMAMLRPREGGFCYAEGEMRTMLLDAEALLDAGADGLVFGCLTAEGTVDESRTRRLAEAAAGRETVFHRAIDVTPDWRRALDTLISLGITRVLTSGQAARAIDGVQTLAEMVRFAGGAIEILPGAGITLQNARRLVAETGCTQVHLSHRKTVIDPSCRGNPLIHFGGALYPPEDCYQATDGDYFAALRSQLP